MNMNEEREQQLVEEYPEVFEYYQKDPDDFGEAPPPISIYGISCGDGWYPIIESLSQRIKNWNQRDNESTVRFVQVKEKFGQLRAYTTPTPEYIAGARHHAETMSRKVCENCGSTRETTKRRDVNGLVKTRCVDCMNSDTDHGEVPIWKFSKVCHRCDENVTVVYPKGVGGPHGGTWESVGEELAELDAGNVQRTYSDVQECEVWGNICPECESYQGNYYVYRKARKLQRLEQSTGTQHYEVVTTISLAED